MHLTRLMLRLRLPCRQIRRNTCLAFECWYSTWQELHGSSDTMSMSLGKMSKFAKQKLPEVEANGG